MSASRGESNRRATRALDVARIVVRGIDAADLRRSPAGERREESESGKIGSQSSLASASRGIDETRRNLSRLFALQLAHFSLFPSGEQDNSLERT